MRPSDNFGNEPFTRNGHGSLLPNADPHSTVCSHVRVKITPLQAACLHTALRAYRKALSTKTHNPDARRAVRYITRIIRALPDPRFKPCMFQLEYPHVEWPFVSRALRQGGYNPAPGLTAKWLATYHALNRRGFARISTTAGDARRIARTKRLAKPVR
jgi:hypothetical protein